MVVGQIPDRLNASISRNLQTISNVVAGHETIANCCHPMLPRNGEMVCHPLRRSVTCR